MFCRFIDLAFISTDKRLREMHLCKIVNVVGTKLKYCKICKICVPLTGGIDVTFEGTAELDYYNCKNKKTHPLRL